MREWKKMLHKLGFTDSEVDIYLSSLELGPSPVQKIAKKAGVSRVTGYSAIEELMELGLMSAVEKGKKKLYAAEPPERLLSVAKSKAMDLEATVKEVEANIGELRLMRRGETPVVKVFEGPEALEAIKADMVSTKPTFVYEFENLDEFRSLENIPQFSVLHDQLSKMNISRSLIYASSNEPDLTERENQEVRFIEGEPDFYGSVSVYDGKVVLSTYRGKQIAVLIDSEIIANTMAAFFQLALGKRRLK